MDAVGANAVAPRFGKFDDFLAAFQVYFWATFDQAVFTGGIKAYGGIGNIHDVLPFLRGFGVFDGFGFHILLRFTVRLHQVGKFAVLGLDVGEADGTVEVFFGLAIEDCVAAHEAGVGVPLEAFAFGPAKEPYVVFSAASAAEIDGSEVAGAGFKEVSLGGAGEEEIELDAFMEAINGVLGAVGYGDGVVEAAGFDGGRVAGEEHQVDVVDLGAASADGAGDFNAIA